MKTGLEIEVPFKFYFPEIYSDFFRDQKYSEFSESKLCELNNRIKIEEPHILEKLTKFSQKHNLKRGRDPYWEFILPPTDSIENHKEIISDLINNNLLPKDIPTSLHITTGGLSRIKAYAILLLLELKFATRKRILSGFGDGHDRLTWNRKGIARICTKYRISLDHDERAFELRTLKVEPTLIGNVLDYFVDLVNNSDIVNIAKAKLKEMDLPFAVWDKEDFVKFSNYLSV